jgi:hypothetical protein
MLPSAHRGVGQCAGSLFEAVRLIHRQWRPSHRNDGRRENDSRHRGARSSIPRDGVGATRCRHRSTQPAPCRRAAKLAVGYRIPAVSVIHGFAEEGRLMSHAPATKAARRRSPSGWIRPSCPSRSTPRCFRQMRPGVKAWFGTAKTQARNNRRSNLPVPHAAAPLL